MYSVHYVGNSVYAAPTSDILYLGVEPLLEASQGLLQPPPQLHQLLVLGLQYRGNGTALQHRRIGIAITWEDLHSPNMG